MKEMERKIAVVNNALLEEQYDEIRAKAKELGFTVDFYTSPEEAEGKIGDAEVLFCQTPAVIRSAVSAKWCQSTFAGIDKFLGEGGFPFERAMLTNGAGSYGVTISEHIIMVTLMLLKRMPDYNKIMEGHRWQTGIEIHSIYGSRVLIMGTGDIGCETARRMKALGAKEVIGASKSGISSESYFDRMMRSEEVDEVLSDIDILILAMPDTPETRGILSRERIASMKKSAVIVNVGRGSAIDQEALIEALEGEKIAGAALDVTVPEPLPPEHPLWTAKNCIVTPHISGNMSLRHTRIRSVELFLANLERYANEEPLVHQVDPERGY